MHNEKKQKAASGNEGMTGELEMHFSPNTSSLPTNDQQRTQCAHGGVGEKMRCLCRCGRMANVLTRL
jgi:hypothetical protein